MTRTEHVPWYQGIEFFIAMRRLGKPAWLLNYNGEPHWAQKRAEQDRLPEADGPVLRTIISRESLCRSG